MAPSSPKDQGGGSAPRSLPVPCRGARGCRQASLGTLRQDELMQLVLETRGKRGHPPPPPEQPVLPALSPSPGAVSASYPWAEPPGGPVGPWPTLLGINVCISGPQEWGMWGCCSAHHPGETCREKSFSWKRGAPGTDTQGWCSARMGLSQQD